MIQRHTSPISAFLTPPISSRGDLQPGHDMIFGVLWCKNSYQLCLWYKSGLRQILKIGILFDPLYFEQTTGWRYWLNQIQEPRF